MTWPYPASLNVAAYPKLVPTQGRRRNGGDFSQYPAETLDYDNDFSTGALAPGEVLTASTWTAEIGITIRDGGFTDTMSTIWISGGDEGRRYWVRNVVVTSGGRTMERILTVRIKGHPCPRHGRLSGHGALSGTT